MGLGQRRESATTLASLRSTAACTQHNPMQELSIPCCVSWCPEPDYMTPVQASAAAQQEEEPFEAAFQHLRQYSDTADGELAVLHAWREERRGRLASALK